MVQTTEQLQVEPYEHTDQRKEYRNVTYPHQLITRIGTITLHIQYFRNGQFSIEMFERYKRSEQAFILALLKMVVNGVSARKKNGVQGRKYVNMDE